MIVFHRLKRTGRPFALALLVLAIPGVSGCRPNSQQHADFAKAGAIYTQSLSALLDVSANQSIDAHSVQLLQKRSIGPIPETLVQDFAQVDADRLQTTARLRHHSALLARYFNQLNDLATSNAPDHGADDVNSTTKALTQVGDELRNPSLTKLAGGRDFALPTQLAVSALIRGRLNSELQKRQSTVRAELKTQEELLAALADDNEQNARVLSNARQDLQVSTPLRAGIPPSGEEEWIVRRRTILTAPTTVEELHIASEDVAHLREAFEGLVQGTSGREKFDQALSDFSALLLAAQALQHRTGGNDSGSGGAVGGTS